jgi:hypothetical protein
MVNELLLSVIMRNEGFSLGAFHLGIEAVLDAIAYKMPPSP